MLLHAETTMKIYSITLSDVNEVEESYPDIGYIYRLLSPVV